MLNGKKGYSQNATKADVIEEIYLELDSKIQKKVISQVLNTALYAISGMTKQGWVVTFAKFGTFDRTSRKFHNPRTGKKQTSKPKLHFKPGKGA